MQRQARAAVECQRVEASAVNAARHGALLARDGELRIGWRRFSHGSGFELDWVEKGPPNNRSGSKNGFGSLLMAAMIEKQLTVDWRGPGYKTDWNCEWQCQRWRPRSGRAGLRNRNHFGI